LARGIAYTDPKPDIIDLLGHDESDVGFATHSPPAQATKYGPADHCVVLEGMSPV
jgi:hypothetical protein